MKNDTILDSEDFKCLDKISARKYLKAPLFVSLNLIATSMCTIGPRRARRDAFSHGRQQRLCDCAKLTHKSAVRYETIFSYGMNHIV